jgi:hypothetical protein
MTSFLQRLGAAILGVLSGFDRIRLRGALPRLSHTGRSSRWLEARRVPLEVFSASAQARRRRTRTFFSHPGGWAIPGTLSSQVRSLDRRFANDAGIRHPLRPGLDSTGPAREAAWADPGRPPPDVACGRSSSCRPDGTGEDDHGVSSGRPRDVRPKRRRGPWLASRSAPPSMAIRTASGCGPSDNPHPTAPSHGGVVGRGPTGAIASRSRERQ